MSKFMIYVTVYFFVSRNFEKVMKKLCHQIISYGCHFVSYNGADKDKVRRMTIIRLTFENRQVKHSPSDTK